MSEKNKFEWDATRANGENSDEGYLASIIAELNEINRQTGQPEVRLVNDEARARERELTRAGERELVSARESELARARELALQQDRELEQARGLSVREIMAEDEKAREVAKARENIKIISKPSEFDPDMRELTVARNPRREIDVIGQGTEPVDKELAKRVDEIMALKKELEQIDQEISEIKAKAEPAETTDPAETAEPENPEPLVAVGVDWTRSEDRLARRLARKDLKEELKGANIIKRIWKGNLFRQYYEDKYMDEYLDGERTTKDGFDLYEIIDDQKQKLVDEIISDVTEDVREKNREEMNRRLVPLDEETNAKIKSTIEDYARFMYELSEIRPDMANDPEFVEEVDDKFNRYTANLLEDAENAGKIDGFIEHNNYLNVAKEAANRYQEAAKNAKNKVEQDAAMAKVMVGFKAYNYESIKRFSEGRRRNIDRIMDRIGSRRIVSAETFSNAANAAAIDEQEAEIIDNIKSGEELIGGEEGIKIMLDQSPISVESQKRWQKWWDSLTDEGRDYVGKIIKQVNAYPDRYNLKWGNGFRTWLTIKNAHKILAA